MTGDRPHRVQRSRRKDSRLEPNTVVVSRGTKWGNPFRVGDIRRAEAVELYRRWIVDQPLDPSELAGKNLACWCRLDEPCHADVLLELANRPAQTT